jgi:hypothetical protein
MLVELAIAVAEQLLSQDALPNWDVAVSLALMRQRRLFDTCEPTSLREIDKVIALQVARNLTFMKGGAIGTVCDDRW